MSNADSAAELQQLQRQLQLYDRHLASLEQNLAELQTAIATLDGLKGESALDTRVPVGAGVRIAATVDPTQTVLVDIGAGYATEMDIPDALSKLRDRLQQVESAFRTASSDAEKVGQRMQQLQLEQTSPSS